MLPFTLSTVGRANPTRDATVPLLLWSNSEGLVTIMCSTIPVLRPLYVRFWHKRDGTSYGANSSYKLPMYGSGRKYGTGSNNGFDSEIGTETKRTSHRAVATYNANNTSDESILGAAAAIKRTDEVSVSYESFGRRS